MFISYATSIFPDVSLVQSSSQLIRSVTESNQAPKTGFYQYIALET